MPGRVPPRRFALRGAEPFPTRPWSQAACPGLLSPRLAVPPREPPCHPTYRRSGGPRKQQRRRVRSAIDFSEPGRKEGERNKRANDSARCVLVFLSACCRPRSFPAFEDGKISLGEPSPERNLRRGSSAPIVVEIRKLHVTSNRSNILFGFE
jgi:hypothetical protein